MLRGAVSSGIEGWRDDDLALVSDWGFDLNQLTAIRGILSDLLDMADYPAKT